MKEDLQGINIRKDRKGKKEKYCSTFIWNRIIRTDSNWKNQQNRTILRKEASTNPLGEYVKSREYKRTEYSKPSSEVMLCIQGRRT